jgi:hypothetical protein
MTGRLFISLLCTVVIFAAATSRGEVKRIYQAGLTVEESVEKDSKKDQTRRNDSNGTTITTKTDNRTEDCTLVIQVDNRADHPDTYELVVGFLAKNVALDKTVVSEATKKTITVAANETFTETLTKKFVLTETVVDNSYEAKRTSVGDTYAGYIVLVKAGGEILAQESNSSRYLKDEWILQCQSVAKPGGKK